MHVHLVGAVEQAEDRVREGGRGHDRVRLVGVVAGDHRRHRHLRVARHGARVAVPGSRRRRARRSWGTAPRRPGPSRPARSPPGTRRRRASRRAGPGGCGRRRRTSRRRRTPPSSPARRPGTAPRTRAPRSPGPAATGERDRSGAAGTAPRSRRRRRSPPPAAGDSVGVAEEQHVDEQTAERRKGDLVDHFAGRRPHQPDHGAQRPQQERRTQGDDRHERHDLGPAGPVHDEDARVLGEHVQGRLEEDDPRQRDELEQRLQLTAPTADAGLRTLSPLAASRAIPTLRHAVPGAADGPAQPRRRSPGRMIRSHR